MNCSEYYQKHLWETPPPQRYQISNREQVGRMGEGHSIPRVICRYHEGSFYICRSQVAKDCDIIIWIGCKNQMTQLRQFQKVYMEATPIC